MWCFYKLGEGVLKKNCANALIVYGMFIVCSYLSGSIGIVRKNVTKDAVMVCICIITHTIFFIIIAPVSHYRGTPRFWAFFGLFFCGWGWMEGGTDGLPEGRLRGRAWCGRFAGSY